MFARTLPHLNNILNLMTKNILVTNVNNYSDDIIS